MTTMTPVRKQKLRRLSTYMEAHTLDPFRTQAVIRKIAETCDGVPIDGPMDVAKMNRTASNLEDTCIEKVRQEWQASVNAAPFWRRGTLREQEMVWRITRFDELKVESLNEVNDLLIEQ